MLAAIYAYWFNLYDIVGWRPKTEKPLGFHKRIDSHSSSREDAAHDAVIWIFVRNHLAEESAKKTSRQNLPVVWKFDCEFVAFSLQSVHTSVALRDFWIDRHMFTVTTIRLNFSLPSFMSQDFSQPTSNRIYPFKGDAIKKSRSNAVHNRDFMLQ